MAQFIDEDDKTQLAESMVARGVEGAELQLMMPYVDPLQGSHQPFPPELLDQFPDDVLVHSVAVFWQMSPLQGQAETIDPDMMKRCYTLLREKHPQTALAAALYGAASGSKEGTALAMEALQASGEIDEPCSHLQFVMQQLLYNRFGNSPSLVAGELRKAIGEYSLAWRQRKIAKALEDGDDAYLSQSFDPEDAFLLGAMAGGDMERWLTHAESEVQRYEKLEKRLGKGRIPGLARNYSWVARDMPLIGPMNFPPYDLAGFPGNVLRGLVEIPNYGRPMVIDLDALAGVIGKVRNPLLRVLIATRTEAENLEEIFAAYLDSEAMADTERPALRDIMMAAGYYESAEEHEDAIQWLQKARFYPVDQAMRRRLDGAIVWNVLQLDGSESEKSASMGGRLSCDCVTDCWHRRSGSNWSRRWKISVWTSRRRFCSAKNAAAGSPPSSMVRTRSVATQSLLEKRKEQIDELFNTGKRSEALETLAKTIETELRPQVNAINAVVSIDYRVSNFINGFGEDRRDEAIALLKPGANNENSALAKSADDPRAWYGYATALMTVGRSKPAIEAWEQGFAVSGSKAAPAQILLHALLVGTVDPEKAAERLAAMDRKWIRMLPGAYYQVSNNLDRGNNRDEGYFSKLRMAEAVALLMERLAAEGEKQSALSVLGNGSLDSDLLYNAYGNEFRLPWLFGAPEEVFVYGRGSNEEMAAEAAARRLEVFEKLCRAKMLLPELAREGAGELLSVSLSPWPDGERLAELDALAEAAMDSQLKAINKMSQNNMVYSSPEQRFLTIWAGRGIPDLSRLPAIRCRGTPGSRSSGGQGREVPQQDARTRSEGIFRTGVCER